MVSACVIAYNHEKFIGAALKGAQSQELDHPYEIVLGDDKSPDETLAIAKELADQDPRIRILEREKNLGMHGNWRATIAACEGDYIAMIEADDYWKDPKKLQKQVDLLESRPDLAATFHYAEVSYEDTLQSDSPLEYELDKTEFTIEDVILRKWFIPTASVVFRKSMLHDLNWTDGLSSIDVPLLLSVSQHGGIQLIPEKMGVYRIHPGGVSEATWGKRQKTVEFSSVKIFERFDQLTNGKYRDLVNQRLSFNYQALMKKNDFFSSAYQKARKGYAKADPNGYKIWLKGKIINSLVPNFAYQWYRNLTKGNG